MSTHNHASPIFLQALRMTSRDWRAGELRFLLAALALAVAALSAVGFFVERLNSALTRDAAQLLGADLVIRSDYAIRDEWRAKAKQYGLHTAETVTFPSMASTGKVEEADTRLVAVKAVSTTYPLRGAVTVKLDGERTSTSPIPAPGSVWVESAFLTTRQVHVGQTLQLGEREFLIAGEILQEQDRGAGFMNFAPRVMLSLEDLPSTGLVQPGSRITYRLQLAGDANSVSQYQQWLDEFIKQNAVRGVQLESLESGRPEMRTTLDRARQFLSLVGLLTAMLAALAIAIAARRFMQRHTDACAMLRCLGLKQDEVTRLYFIEFTVVGVVGSLLGVALGFSAHFFLLKWLGALITSELPPPSWLPVGQGLATGCLLLQGFALPAVVQLRNVSHNRVIRRESEPAQTMTLVTYAMGLVSFIALLVWQARDLKLGLLTCGGFIAGMAIFMLISWLLLRAFQAIAFPLTWHAWRFAQTSLKRRPSASALQIVAL